LGKGEQALSTTADVVVVGGGITGTSAAYQLARRGMRVLLLEKRFLGAGSTGKSSAIIRQHYSNEVTARMALHSLRVFQNFADEVGGDAGFVQTGFAMLVEAKDRAGLAENVRMQRALGVNTSVLSPEELRAIDPYLSITTELAASYEPEGGYADPAATVMSFGEAAKRHGAEIWQETRVTSVLMQNGRVIGVDTTHGEIAAPNVVNCANAWAPQLAATVGVSLPIRPERHQVATFQRSAEMERSHLTAGDFVNNIYYRPEGARLTLVGSIDPNHGQEIDPDHYNEAADYPFVEDSAQRIGRRYPAMEHSWSKGGWSGIYGVTPDWHPIVDEVPPDSGSFVAAGFSGHGFKLGPAVGILIADMVTRASAPTEQLDRSLFRFARFAEGKPVVGKYEYGIVG
jgi:glycine/D-amino acid oxidase-like deaminating enzyme